MFRRTMWSDSKDSKCWNCNSTGSLTHHSWCGKPDSKNTGLKWFWFSVGRYVMDQRSGDGWFFGRNKLLAIGFWKDFPKFEMLDAKIASALNKIKKSSHFKKKVSLVEQKAQKEDRSLRGWQIAFMIYDFFWVAGAHDTVLDYADLFSVTLRNDNDQEFDTRWDEVLLSIIRYDMGRSSVIDNKNSIRWNIGESVQIKDTWVWSTQKAYLNCTTWRFIRRNRIPIIKNWRRWWRGV